MIIQQPNEKSKVEEGVSFEEDEDGNHHSRIRRARDMLIFISRTPPVLLGERRWSSIYCLMSDSNVLQDNMVRELIQSTGDLAIMNQYICIMQNRSLCLKKELSTFIYHDFVCYEKADGETSPLRSNITHAPEGIVSREADCEPPCRFSSVYNKEAFTDNAWPIPSEAWAGHQLCIIVDLYLNRSQVSV